ncbi:hypothetical protein RBSH_02788 [Rhodopirellula baltica SH28]|uniref:Uncharacterized protein n=1 Tax=Rhodopirellula baltica SH28 TaxID=993517 RepID=K5D5H1_RHOBT|nr:hypothetical protein RBSH_02788 [Rhodopirellula baltica SH28]
MLTYRMHSHVTDSGSESVGGITRSLAYAAGYDLERLGPLGLQTESL